MNFRILNASKTGTAAGWVSCSKTVATTPQVCLLHMTQTRKFHAVRATLKNPYFFYDLAARQPRHTNSHIFDPTNTKYGHEHLSAVERAHLVFGKKASREASRAESLRNARTIAGIKVPARPDEPTNCCMSGCIDCVWELYKEDLNDWKAKKREVYKALLAKPSLKWPQDLLGPEPEIRKTPAEKRSEAEHKKAQEELLPDYDEDEDLDVSIKQFLKVEKRLKAKRAKAASQLSSIPQSPNSQTRAGV